MWGNYFHAVTEPGWHRAPMDRTYPFYVVMETAGSDSAHDADSFISALEQAVEEGLIIDAIIPKSETERDALWAIREDFEAITNVEPTFLYDVSLPIKHMDEYTRRVAQGLEARWPGCICYVLGHIGDGNLHFFVTPLDGDVSMHADSDRDVYGPLMDFGGSVSAEHGVGLEKKGWLARSRSETELNLMRQIKRSLDPNNLLNPGKIFSA
jgi:FAD/FMN-containing dehydrogenase